MKRRNKRFLNIEHLNIENFLLQENIEALYEILREWTVSVNKAGDMGEDNEP